MSDAGTGNSPRPLLHRLCDGVQSPASAPFLMMVITTRRQDQSTPPKSNHLQFLVLFPAS